MSVATPSDAQYQARATYKLRASYALGAMLRGNPAAQRYFVLHSGAEALARRRRSGRSVVDGEPPRGDIHVREVVRSVAAPAGDAVGLHWGDCEPERQEACFGRRTGVRARVSSGRFCRLRQRRRSEWNRKGADDDGGLDSVYRRELLDFANGVLEALLR